MEKRVIALGFFDGVHLGHGSLLKRARELADRCGCKAKVVTFDRQPASVIRGETPLLLSSPADREYLMKTLYGIDEVEFLHFGRSMMELDWESFLRGCLMEEAGACHLVCGFDYRFGYRGLGNAELLRGFCEENGIGCDVLPELKIDGVPVHSSTIRALLQEGQLEEAERLLGHPYLLSGTVISGKQLGRTLGTPTANLDFSNELLPLPNGVYVTEACFDGMRCPSVTNVGCCPTVGGRRMTVETWLLDFSGDLYGKELRLFFLRHLRDEIRFASLGELRSSILRDGEAAKRYFSEKT